MDLWEIRAEIPADAAEQTELVLLESGDGAWTLAEDALARRAWVVGFFGSEGEAASHWGALMGSLPAAPRGNVRPRRLPDSDWKNSYRAHFRAWTFGRLHWVPVWERDSFRLPAGHSVVWLDPGMAFGTGNHETTRLCIERLVEFEAVTGEHESIRVLDAGCGSGILALSAARLGFRDVTGFDNDPEAIRVSIENAVLNGLSGGVRFMVAGLPGGLGGGCSDVVLANIQSDVLVRYSGELLAVVAPGGMLAMSGILASEIGTVRAAFTAAAPSWAFDTRTLGEWCDACLRRPPTRTARESSSRGTPPCRPSSPCPR
ncbi:MAG TPA: 50S ribosomal protein L11 methyltransferase [Opitutaceae bacterium]|nr:50S ribosomal protein L11 methyltransferase [Opitutaceae bacterium]